MKKKNNIILAAVLVISLSFLFNSMYKYFVKQKKQEKIICIIKNQDYKNGFWFSVKEGAELAAKEYNIDFTLLGAKSEANYKEQNQIILDAIKQKPDAIILAASDYEKTCQAAKKIKENNIELVLIDSILKEDIASSIVGTNNFEAGIKMGAVINNLLKKDNWKLGIVSHVKGSSTAIERENGIRTALGDKKNQIIDTVYCDSDYEKAEEITKQLLEEHKDIKVLAGLNQYSSIGVAKAVVEMGLEKKIKVIGFDSSKEQIKYLEAGMFQAIVIQKPFNIGYLGVENAVKLIRKEKINPIIDSGSLLITKENMYMQVHQKLLFPFIEE